ncbi:MAG: hypothetical protein ACFFD2_14630 [Promethearchaeota archaeon]
MDSINALTEGRDTSLLENLGLWTAIKIYLDPVLRTRQLLNITLPLNFGNITEGMNIGSLGGLGGLGGNLFVKSAENGKMGDWNWTYMDLLSATLNQTNIIEGPIDFKQLQFNATGNIEDGIITLWRPFNYTVPATSVVYRLRTNNLNPIFSVILVSQNATGDDVYAIQVHNFSDFTEGKWYDFSYDLRSQIHFWEYYDNSFDPQQIKGIELRIIPNTTSPVNIDIDFLNLSREIVPYPYDITILDGYLIGDGIEILPNITIWDKWTDGLIITALEVAEMTGDYTNDIVAASNDGNIYLLNGSNGFQIWNFSAKGRIINLFLEDIVGDPTPEVIFGTENGIIYIINNDQVVISNFSIGSNLDYFILENLDSIGNHEFILVNDNNITVVDYLGNLFWNRTVKGSIITIKSADLNGNGFEEIGVATNKYRIYTLNGTDGTVLWDYITEERPTHLEIGNLWGDSDKELIYSTDKDYYVILDGNQGIHIINISTDTIIRGIYLANFSNNAYNDIIIHTGSITRQNLSVVAGNTFNSLWNFTTSYGINTIVCTDFLFDDLDEVIIATVDNRIYSLNSSGNLKFNFTTPKSVNDIIFGELTSQGSEEFIFGMGNNHILALNGTNQQKLWMIELGVEIITFQFIRTNETIQLLYNLPSPFTGMLDLFGFSLTRPEDLANLANFDINLGLGGISGASGINGFDFSSMNFTSSIPLKGLGIMNMLEMEITLIMNLQDMKMVSASQHAFTGVHEVRYTYNDSIDYRFYPIITEDTNAKYIQYKIRNFEEQPITAHYFVLNMTLNEQPLPLERITIEGWNGTHFVDLGNNPIYNITMAQLGLNYADGKLIFKPNIEIEELEKMLLTVDWTGRELRVKVNTSFIDLNKLSIEPWVDVSIELPGIEMPSVSSIISYSKTFPTFIVMPIPTPNITDDMESRSFLEVLLTNPAFWSLTIMALGTIFGFGYMRKREEKEVKIIAAKNIIKWMKKREESWQTSMKANVMSKGQFYELKRIRYRIKKEITQNQLELSFNKILKWKFFGSFISTIFFMRFWRGINKKSRLIWILNTLEIMILKPFKKVWATFKTALGYLNPWDMDRQKKKELQKKAKKKHHWKKIELPRKPIRKKKNNVFTTSPPSASISEVEDLKKKKKKRWEGQYRNDGGILLKKLNKTRKLPPIGSRDGQIFYKLSTRKYVGMTLKELANLLKLKEYEVLVSLIRLFEKNLIYLLQEGKTLSEDLWDIAPSLRKYDSELEKLIDSIENIEDEIIEGMKFLSSEIKNDKENDK